MEETEIDYLVHPPHSTECRGKRPDATHPCPRNCTFIKGTTKPGAKRRAGPSCRIRRRSTGYATTNFEEARALQSANPGFVVRERQIIRDLTDQRKQYRYYEPGTRSRSPSPSPSSGERPTTPMTPTSPPPVATLPPRTESKYGESVAPPASRVVTPGPEGTLETPGYDALDLSSYSDRSFNEFSQDYYNLAKAKACPPDPERLSRLARYFGLRNDATCDQLRNIQADIENQREGIDLETETECISPANRRIRELYGLLSGVEHKRPLPKEWYDPGRSREFCRAMELIEAENWWAPEESKRYEGLLASEPIRNWWTSVGGNEAIAGRQRAAMEAKRAREAEAKARAEAEAAGAGALTIRRRPPVGTGVAPPAAAAPAGPPFARPPSPIGRTLVTTGRPVPAGAGTIALRPRR